MSIHNYRRLPRRAFADSVAKYYASRPAEKSFALTGPGSASLATWFLGPKAENQEWFEKLVLQALRAHAFARKEYQRDDPIYVTQEIKDSKAFKEGSMVVEEALANLVEELRGSVPFYSHRWQGHMN